MSQLKCKAQAQLPEEWKENSIQNVSDIAIENQRLKKEILSEEYECERFVEKMKELLDAHDKGGLCRTTSKHGYHSIMPPGKKK